MWEPLHSRTFVKISCKRQTVVSHSSTKAEIISLDADVISEGIPALNLWDLVIDVLEPLALRYPLHNTKPQKTKSLMADKRSTDSMDYVSPNWNSSSQRASLWVFEDNDAVIRMIIKGWSPSMRHISRTHRVNLDLLFDQINLDPSIRIKCANTSKQIADILTKGPFSRENVSQLTQLFKLMTPHNALLQPCFGICVCTGRRQDVWAPARTYRRRRHRQTKAGA